MALALLEAQVTALAQVLLHIQATKAPWLVMLLLAEVLELHLVTAPRAGGMSTTSTDTSMKVIHVKLAKLLSLDLTSCRAHTPRILPIVLILT